MSTQTGIRANDGLADFFGKCRSGRYRMFKVAIANEKLALDGHHEARGTWDRDWDPLVLGAIEENEPCYILYRLDEKDGGGGFRWVLISWSPDSSSIRSKMLYASTKASLKNEFGGGQIKDDLYGNVREDVTLEGYKKHVISAAAPGPMSREELEREEVKVAQSNVAISVDTKQQTMAGVLFPMTNAVEAAVREVLSGAVEYVQMSIDTKKEIINLEEKGKCTLPNLPKKVPAEMPRYHIFVFPHTHEGDFLKSIVFIYTMPGYNCSIKERMLYSSCKASLVDRLESQLGLEITKKIEVDSGDELTEEFLMSEIHPVKNLNRPKFAKPAPPSRGNRRITKQPVS